MTLYKWQFTKWGTRIHEQTKDNEKLLFSMLEKEGITEKVKFIPLTPSYNVKMDQRWCGCVWCSVVAAKINKRSDTTTFNVYIHFSLFLKKKNETTLNCIHLMCIAWRLYMLGKKIKLSYTGEIRGIMFHGVCNKKSLEKR